MFYVQLADCNVFTDWLWLLNPKDAGMRAKPARAGPQHRNAQVQLPELHFCQSHDIKGESFSRGVVFNCDD
jgi:hypothetical protein